MNGKKSNSRSRRSGRYARQKKPRKKENQFNGDVIIGKGARLGTVNLDVDEIHGHISENLRCMGGRGMTHVPSQTRVTLRAHLPPPVRRVDMDESDEFEEEEEEVSRPSQHRPFNCQPTSGDKEFPTPNYCILMKKSRKPIRIIETYKVKERGPDLTHSKYPWSSQGGLVLENCYDSKTTMKFYVGERHINLQNLLINWKLSYIGFLRYSKKHKRQTMSLLDKEVEIKGLNGGQIFEPIEKEDTSKKKKKKKRKRKIEVVRKEANPKVKVSFDDPDRDFCVIEVTFRLNNFKPRNGGINLLEVELMYENRVVCRNKYYFKRDNRIEAKDHQMNDRNSFLRLKNEQQQQQQQQLVDGINQDVDDEESKLPLPSCHASDELKNNSDVEGVFPNVEVEVYEDQQPTMLYEFQPTEDDRQPHFNGSGGHDINDFHFEENQCSSPNFGGDLTSMGDLLDQDDDGGFYQQLAVQFSNEENQSPSRRPPPFLTKYDLLGDGDDWGL